MIIYQMGKHSKQIFWQYTYLSKERLIKRLSAWVLIKERFYLIQKYPPFFK